MDYQQYQGDPNFSGNFEQKPPRRSAMETAAFVLSILSILFLSFFPFTLVLSHSQLERTPPFPFSIKTGTSLSEM